MYLLRRRRKIRRSLQQILIFGIIVLFLLFVVTPAIFYYSPTIQRHMVFLPWVSWPKHVNFDRPEDEGLPGTKNFYLETEPKISVGVWHVLPRSLIRKAEGQDKEWYLKSLSRGNTIVLYMHGNTGSRGRDHRTETYNLLRNLDYHVIAFDYRGYADSSPAVPTKTGVVTDGRAVYKYVQKHSRGAPIVIWGHSLGTAVSSEVVSDLCLKGDPPKALILESPFNSIYDEVRYHPMTYLWRKMPYFEIVFSGNLEKNDIGFATDRIISNIHIPILIFHAEDDIVVPFKLGEKLYKVGLESRPASSKPIQFVPFSSAHGYGHKFIYAAPEVPSIVEKFIENSLADNWN